MPYPYGSQNTQVLPDLPYTILQRRQGDVKATLIPITLNGQTINISGFTFHFSVTLTDGVHDVVWTINSPQTGTPITTVAGTGFIVPSYNAVVSAIFQSTSQFSVGALLYIPVAGNLTVSNVASSTAATLLNTGLSGNASSGTIASGTSVYQSGQQGMTVLVIPKNITSAPVGQYPFYLKYDTNDPSPGPFATTFLQGTLQILPQNNPTA